MSDPYLFAFLFYILNFLKIILPVAAIILSIIILTKKDKNAKLLALYCLLMSCSDLFGSITARMAGLSVHAYATATLADSFIEFILTFAALISVGIYAKRRYGSKANIMVPCVYIAAQFAGRMVIFIANSVIQGKDSTELLQILFVSLSISAVLELVPYIVLLCVLCKHGKKETQFPYLWKIMFLIATAESLVTVSSILGMYEKMDSYEMSFRTTLLTELSPLAMILLRLCLAIYVLRHVKDKKEE